MREGYELGLDGVRTGVQVVFHPFACVWEDFVIAFLVLGVYSYRFMAWHGIAGAFGEAGGPSKVGR